MRLPLKLVLCTIAAAVGLVGSSALATPLEAGIRINAANQRATYRGRSVLNHQLTSRRDPSAPQTYPTLDLGGQIGVVYPTQRDSSLAGSGLHLTFEPVIRLGPHFGVGLSLQHSELSWHAQGSSTEPIPFGEYFPDKNGRIGALRGSILARWYPLNNATWVPYLQAAIGYGDYIQVPEHPQCSVNDSAFPSIAGGVEYSLLKALRVGLSSSAFLFGLGQGCTGDGIPGAPPAPPWPRFGVTISAAVTGVWVTPTTH